MFSLSDDTENFDFLFAFLEILSCGKSFMFALYFTTFLSFILHKSFYYMFGMKSRFCVFRVSDPILFFKLIVSSACT